MGACLSKMTVAPWPELPPEIAGLIFCRLLSHDDRLSFSATCHAWHIAARQQGQLPLAAPCINLGQGVYRSLIDGKVRRFPTPKGDHAGSFFDGWLFCYHEGSGRAFLHAPFSRAAAIEVPTRYNMSWIPSRYHTELIGRDMDMKIVVCPSGRVIALFRHPRQGYFEPVSYIACFQPGQRSLAWSFLLRSHYDDGLVHTYMDIAFYRGKVFALSYLEQLFRHDFEGETRHDRQPRIVQHVNEAEPTTLTNCYLVVSFDQKNLLMVRWMRSVVTLDGRRPMDVWVFKADFRKRRWVEVKDLGEQVIFLSRNCSKAFAAGSTKHWGPRFRGGGNRVFVLGTEWAQSLPQPVYYKRRDLPSYYVYDMTSGETSFISLGRRPRYTDSYASGWFFPH